MRRQTIALRIKVTMTNDRGRALAVCQAFKKRYESALLAIAHMDIYTREGEKEPHDVMREIAKEALHDRS